MKNVHFTTCWYIQKLLRSMYVLRFYSPVNPMRSFGARSVQPHFLLGRLSPISGQPVLCTFFRQKLKQPEGRDISLSISTKECWRPGWGRTRNLLITSRTWIQLSHRGRPDEWQSVRLLISHHILWRLVWTYNVWWGHIPPTLYVI